MILILDTLKVIEKLKNNCSNQKIMFIADYLNDSKDL